MESKTLSQMSEKELRKAEERKLPLIVRVTSVIFPFIALYIQYSFVFETVGLTVAVILSVLCLLKAKEIKFNKPFVLFSAFYILRMMINFVLPNGAFSRPTIMSFAIIIAATFSILVLPNFINKEIMYRVWKRLAIVVVLVLVYQFALINLVQGYATPIRIFPDSGTVWMTMSNRPSAFFTEPAVVAMFLSPVLLIALSKKEYLFAVFISLGVLLSTSTIGLISIAVLWIAFILVDKNAKASQRVVLVVLIAAIGFLAFNASFFSATVDKLNSEIEGTNGTNSYIRVEMGYDFFNQLPAQEKILGTFYQSVRALLMSGRIHVDIKLSEDLYGYVNTSQIVLLTTGILGAVLYVLMYLRLFKHATNVARIYVLLQFVLIFGSKNFYGSLYLIPFITLFAINEQRDSYVLNMK